MDKLFILPKILFNLPKTLFILPKNLGNLPKSLFILPKILGNSPNPLFFFIFLANRRRTENFQSEQHSTRLRTHNSTIINHKTQ